MRQSNADYLTMISAIADYVRSNPQDYYNTQKIAGHIRSVMGEDKLPKGRSGRIFSNLYEKKIFIRNTDLISGKKKRYFVFVDLRNIERIIGGTPDRTLEEAKQAVRDEVKLSYTLGGEPVSDEFYKKFSDRFKPSERNASYTFRGAKIPDSLNALIEAIIPNA